MHFSRLSLARRAGQALALYALYALAACSQIPATPPKANVPLAPPPWETFASPLERPRAAPVEPVARLLFLRPNSPDNSRVPTDIFINGRLHAALLPGGFAEVDVCQGSIRLSLGGQGTHGLSRRTEQTVQARAGQTTYVQVQAPGAAEPLTTAGDAEQARAQLSGLRRQTHAISRVPAADCPALPPAPVAVAVAPPPPPPPAAPPVAYPTRYTLSAEMLFSFGGSKPQDLSEQGQTQIVRMARQIKQQLRPGQTVVVQGHTDPTGSVALNKRLSLERAETVKRILVNGGLSAPEVRAEGLGPSQLLIPNCDRIATNREQKINCNRPNRRVEITIAPTKTDATP